MDAALPRRAPCRIAWTPRNQFPRVFGGRIGWTELPPLPAVGAATHSAAPIWMSNWREHVNIMSDPRRGRLPADEGDDDLERLQVGICAMHDSETTYSMISPLREPHDQVFVDYCSHRAQADFLTRREQPAAKVSRIARKPAAAAAEEGPDSAASAGSDAGCATGQPEVAAVDNDAVAHEGADVTLLPRHRCHINISTHRRLMSQDAGSHAVTLQHRLAVALRQFRDASGSHCASNAGLPGNGAHPLIQAAAACSCRASWGRCRSERLAPPESRGRPPAALGEPPSRSPPIAANPRWAGDAISPYTPHTLQMSAVVQTEETAYAGRAIG